MGAVNEKFLYTSRVSLQLISNQKLYNELMERYIYSKNKNVENRFQVILKYFEITAETKKKKKNVYYNFLRKIKKRKKFYRKN